MRHRRPRHGGRPAPDDERLVARCCDALAHRGPDDSTGWATSGRGSERAASRSSTSTAGRQPLTNEAGSILRQPERRDLQLRRAPRGAARGAATRWRPHGDTETIVHLYEEYGDRVRRPPARDVRDRDLGRPRRRLVLARDRLGKKPLYWRLADGRLTLRVGAEGDPQRSRRSSGRRPRGARPVPPAPVHPAPHGRSSRASTSCRRPAS